jgi:hypothetical protein
LLSAFHCQFQAQTQLWKKYFSILKPMRTDDRNSFTTDTVKAIIYIKTHFKILPCNNLRDQILKSPKLLQERHSSHMYKTKDNVAGSKATSWCFIEECHKD